MPGGIGQLLEGVVQLPPEQGEGGVQEEGGKNIVHASKPIILILPY